MSWIPLLAFSLLILAQSPTPHPCTGSRWPVKTLADSEAKTLPTEAVATTVDALLALKPPADPDAMMQRLPPVETTLWKVRARLVEYHVEYDSDYHLTIVDLHSGATMLAEIPAPECSGSHGDVFAHERAFVDALGNHVASSDDWRLDRNGSAPIVTIAGYGFFDHVKKAPDPGAAPNGIEIHPIIEITN